MPVQKGGRDRLSLGREVHGRLQGAALQLRRIKGQAEHPVGVDSPEVRRYQGLGGNLGLLSGHLQFFKHPDAESLKLIVPRHHLGAGGRFFHHMKTLLGFAFLL